MLVTANYRPYARESAQKLIEKGFKVDFVEYSDGPNDASRNIEQGQSFYNKAETNKYDIWVVQGRDRKSLQTDFIQTKCDRLKMISTISAGFNTFVTFLAHIHTKILFCFKNAVLYVTQIRKSKKKKQKKNTKGFNHVPIDFCKEKNIIVTNTPVLLFFFFAFFCFLF